MEQVFFTITLSLLSSYLFFLFLRFRTRSIKADIRALQEEEEFLERLNKGNITLIRTGLKFISLFFGTLFAAGFIFALPQFVPFSDSFTKYIYAVGASLLLGGIFFCVYFLRSLIRLKDIKRTKEMLRKKRDLLESRFNN